MLQISKGIKVEFTVLLYLIKPNNNLSNIFLINKKKKMRILLKSNKIFSLN